MKKMKTKSSKKILPATVFAAILVISVFAVVTTPVGANNGVTQEQKKEAIEKGLEWLANQQDSTSGAWNPGYYPVGSTAFAVLKFEHYAKHVREPAIDPFNSSYEYSDNIVKGWNYLFNQSRYTPIDVQPAGNPDVNLVNGNGTYFVSPGGSRFLYETGIVMMALQTSCHPEREVEYGNHAGLNYSTVMKDLVDYVAWAQNEGACPGPRGGWRYSPNSGSSDNSVSQWPVLGLMSAAGWDVHAPDWVSTELENYWLNYSQDSISGCFGYDGPGSYTGGGPVSVTAAGLIELTYCNVTTDDERWVNGSRCICENWGTSNIGNHYAMYGVMKAAMTAQPDIIWWYNCSMGNHSWQEEYDEWLNETQLLNGSWPGEYALPWAGVGHSNSVLSTEYALLILEKVVPPLPVIHVDVDIKPMSCPNPLNLKSRGVLPVAVLGTEDFDVTTIDPTTILLNRSCAGCVGVAPIRWDYEAVAAPFEGELCDCHELNDTYIDLTLKFDTQELVEKLNLTVEAGNTIPLNLTGNLKEEEGGTAIEGADCIWVLKTGRR